MSILDLTKAIDYLEAAIQSEMESSGKEPKLLAVRPVRILREINDLLIEHDTELRRLQDELRTLRSSEEERPTQ